MITLGIAELVSLGGLLLAVVGLLLRYGPKWAEKFREEGREEERDESLRALVDRLDRGLGDLNRVLSGISSRLDEGEQRMGRMEGDIKKLIGHTGLRSTPNRPNGGHS